MPNPSSVNSNTSKQAPPEVANNFARKGRCVGLNFGEVKEDKRAQNSKGALHAMSMQKLPLCLVPRKDTSEPVQSTKVLFKNEEEENSAKFKAWANHYEGWFEDTPEIIDIPLPINYGQWTSLDTHAEGWTPEVREAFFKYAPEIIKALPDVNNRALASLTSHVGVSAPEVLQAFLTYAPQIMAALPDLNLKDLVTLTYQARERAPEILETFLKYGPEIIKAPLHLNIKTWIALIHHADKRGPEVLAAFLKYGPRIKETLPHFNIKTLITLTYQVGPLAPQRLKFLFEHAPTIQKVLPHFTGATLLPSSDGTPTAGEALITWRAKIKKLLPEVKEEWLIAVAIQKKGYKKLQRLFKYLSKNKKQFPHFNTTQLIQMATFQESGIVGLNLLKKLEMSTFEGINSLLLKMIRELTTFPDTDFFLYLGQFRWYRLRKFGQAVADEERRLLEEYMPPEGMDSKGFTLVDPSYSLSRHAWTRLIELYAWGPSTGLTIDIRRELFNHYLGRAHSPREIHKHRYLLPPFNDSPAPQPIFPKMPAPDDIEGKSTPVGEVNAPPFRTEPSSIGSLIDKLANRGKFIKTRLRQGLKLAIRSLRFLFNGLCLLLPFKLVRQALLKRPERP